MFVTVYGLQNQKTKDREQILRRMTDFSQNKSIEVLVNFNGTEGEVSIQGIPFAEKNC